jgi:hypothetical protein
MEIVKCPHCGNHIPSLKINSMEAEYRQPGSSHVEKIKLAAYSCPLPLCSKVISVQEDPLASKKGIVTAITNLLRGH